MGKIIRLSDKSIKHMDPEKLLEHTINELNDIKDICIVWRNTKGNLFFGRSSGPFNTDVIGMLEYAKQMVFDDNGITE